MLVAGDADSRGINIYIFPLESQQPVGARRTECRQLLWKPHGPSREDTPIYLVTFETSQLVGARHTSHKHLLWKPRHPGRQGRTFKQLPWKPEECICLCITIS
jgi:hypothetical protein